MSNLPSKIKIGSITFSVLDVERLLDKEQHTKLNGSIHYNECEIRIETSQVNEMKRLTLLHEVMHGLATYSDVSMTESNIERLTTILAAFLVDNPDFLELWK